MNESQLINIVGSIKELIQQARNLAYKQVDLLSVITNFEIGRIIVENEQGGEQRAKYGKETLKEVSQQLTREFGRGYSVDNLQLMRLFFISYIKNVQTPKYETLSSISSPDVVAQKYEALSRI